MSINTLGDTKNHFCNSDMNFKYDTTLYSTVANENERSLNCSVPFHPLTFSEVAGNAIKICTNSKLGKKAYLNYKEIQKSYHHMPKHRPCMGMDVEVLGLPIIDHNQQDSEAFVRLYLKSYVKVKTMIFHYDLSSLAADLGGYIGTLLGISMVNLALKFSNLLFKALTSNFNRT